MIYANTFADRQTMVWAIDLDDRSVLAALSYVSTKEKEHVLLELDSNIQDFGTNWNSSQEVARTMVRGRTIEALVIEQGLADHLDDYEMKRAARK